MKPQIVHRYTLPLQAVIEQLLGQEATDGEGYFVTVEDDDLVVEIIDPALIKSPKPDMVAPLAEKPPPKPSNETEEINTPEKPKGGALAQRAGIMCGERGFWTFIAKRYDVAVGNADEAAAWLKAQCGVESRVEFDHNEAKAANFREIDKFYRLWLDGFD